MKKRGSIFGRKREPELGCGYLSSQEIDSYLEGRLADERNGEFEAHLRGNCTECLHLSAALESFREILDKGALETERRWFESSRRVLKARVRQELERELAEGDGKLLPFSRPGLTNDELETLAAAGSDPHLDPGEDPDEE